MCVKSKMFILLIGFFIASCNQTSVEDDMAEYCDCIKANNGGFGERCKIVLEEIVVKYEYDPDASEYIVEHLNSCPE